LFVYKPNFGQWAGHWSVAFVCRVICLFVCVCPADHNSTAVFTKFHKQVGSSPWKSWLDFQGHGVKTQGHTATTIEIYYTPYLVNRWRDFNPNFIDTYKTGRRDYVFKIMWSQVKVTQRNFG